MNRKFIWIAILVLVIAATTVSQRGPRNPAMSSKISEQALRAHIKFLSDDRLEGRGTGARGGELAALYVAEQFEAMGLKGAGPKGGFWQPVSLVGVKADPRTELRISGARGGDLVVIRQNLETSSQQALEERGKRVRLEWRPEHTYEIPKEGQ